MTMQLSDRVIGAALLLPVVAAPEGESAAPCYPQGYRDWKVTRFRLQGPEHPNYEEQGGFRHYYANSIGLASFAGGDSISGLTAEQAKTHCFEACHRSQEAHNFVFSDPRG